MRRTIELLREHPSLSPRQLTHELPNLSWQKAKHLMLSMTAYQALSLPQSVLPARQLDTSYMRLSMACPCTGWSCSETQHGREASVRALHGRGDATHTVSPLHIPTALRY